MSHLHFKIQSSFSAPSFCSLYIYSGWTADTFQGLPSCSPLFTSSLIETLINFPSNNWSITSRFSPDLAHYTTECYSHRQPKWILTSHWWVCSPYVSVQWLSSTSKPKLFLALSAPCDTASTDFSNPAALRHLHHSHHGSEISHPSLHPHLMLRLPLIPVHEQLYLSQSLINFNTVDDSSWDSYPHRAFRKLKPLPTSPLECSGSEIFEGTDCLTFFRLL